MKSMSYLLGMATASLLFSVVMLVGCSNMHAQEKGRISGTKEELRGVLSDRKISKATLAKAIFDKKVKPVERVKGDHIASGISLRNRGGGVINLRGAPEKSLAVKAYLYWDVLMDRQMRFNSVSVNGVSVGAQLIGQGDSPCWPPAYNFVYRAEVPTHLLYNGINGDYKIAGISSGEGFGMSPWDAATPPLAEGATLVVFFKSPDSTYQTTYIYEQPISGQMFAGQTFSATLTGFNPAQQPTAKFTLVGADGQVGRGLNSSYPTTAETSFFQGTQIAGPPNGGTSLNADSDWNGNDTQPLNQLWDTRTHIVPIKTGSTSAGVKYISHSDCLVVVAFFLGLSN